MRKEDTQKIKIFSWVYLIQLFFLKGWLYNVKEDDEIVYDHENELSMEFAWICNN